MTRQAYRHRRQTAERRRLALGERGAAAVEFAVMLPVLMLILFGIVQMGMLFSVRNTMINAAREAARAMAVEGAGEAESETMASSLLAAYPGMTFDVDAVPADPGAGNPNVSVTIQVPAEDAVLVDVLNLFGGETITAQIVMRQE